MREINFEHYKIFYYVAKFQNITMAANYLFLSQPSISRCVKNLEDELGCKLFVRSKKGVELTTGGEMLFKHISIACKHIFSAEEELALISERDRAIVRLGGSELRRTIWKSCCGRSSPILLPSMCASLHCCSLTCRKSATVRKFPPRRWICAVCWMPCG